MCFVCCVFVRVWGWSRGRQGAVPSDRSIAPLTPPPPPPPPRPSHRALKTKHETPKYGLIYHASLIGQAQPKFKGKIRCGGGVGEWMVGRKMAPGSRALARPPLPLTPSLLACPQPRVGGQVRAGGARGRAGGRERRGGDRAGVARQGEEVASHHAAGTPACMHARSRARRPPLAEPGALISGHAGFERGARAEAQAALFRGRVDAKRTGTAPPRQRELHTPFPCLPGCMPANPSALTHTHPPTHPPTHPHSHKGGGAAAAA